MSCDAKIRPFPDDTELTCEADNHDGETNPEHHATGPYRHPRFPDAPPTVIFWRESDRRNFRGDWVKCSECLLPAGHGGNHA